MSFGEFAKSFGKSAAKSFLDEYDRYSKKLEIMLKLNQ